MKTTITKRITVPANTIQNIALYTIPDGLTFKLQKVLITFPKGTASEVSVRIFYGALQIVPKVGEAVGDDVTLEYPVEGQIAYDSGLSVMATISNINPAIDKDVIITLEGDES